MAQLALTHRSIRSKPDADEMKPDAKHVSPMRLLLSAADSSQLISIQLADRLVIGRGGGGGHEPDINLAQLGGVNYGISRWHAVFSYEENTLFVEDLNSTNGTRINGYRLDSDKSYRLRNGDELELGHLRLIVRVVRPPG